MMIRVMYLDGTTDMVRPPLLQLLLATGKIQKFRRSDGWVTVGIDRLREDKKLNYRGEDRRDSAAKP